MNDPAMNAEPMSNGLMNNGSMNDGADPLKTLSVLYVEDDAETRMQFAHMLEKIVGTLYTAADGAEGLEIFRSAKPDLIISDIMMPVMDGLEMAENIRAENPATSIILTTAFSDAHYLMRAIGIGIDNYVLKPVDYQMLRKAIAKSAHALLRDRELKIKSAQLELYHAAAEDERRLVGQLMERMMQAAGLRDEGLRYWLQPSDVVSGDLVTASRASNGKLFVMVADSTGHGLPAAINLLPLNRIFYRMVEKGFPVGTIVEEMNLTIKEQSPTDRFVAATLAAVDGDSRIIEMWSGGNPAAIFVNGRGELLHAFASANLPLGVLDKTFIAHPTLFHWEAPGYLLMFSDGLLDAENEEGAPFGSDGVQRTIIGAPPETWTAAIQEALRRHLGRRRAHDDLSLVIVNCP